MFSDPTELDRVLGTFCDAPLPTEVPTKKKKNPRATTTRAWAGAPSQSPVPERREAPETSPAPLKQRLANTTGTSKQPQTTDASRRGDRGGGGGGRAAAPLAARRAPVLEGRRAQQQPPIAPVTDSPYRSVSMASFQTVSPQATKSPAAPSAANEERKPRGRPTATAAMRLAAADRARRRSATTTDGMGQPPPRGPRDHPSGAAVVAVDDDGKQGAATAKKSVRKPDIEDDDVTVAPLSTSTAAPAGPSSSHSGLPTATTRSASGQQLRRSYFRPQSSPYGEEGAPQHERGGGAAARSRPTPPPPPPPHTARSQTGPDTAGASDLASFLSGSTRTGAARTAKKANTTASIVELSPHHPVVVVEKQQPTVQDLRRMVDAADAAEIRRVGALIRQQADAHRASVAGLDSSLDDEAAFGASAGQQRQQRRQGGPPFSRRTASAPAPAARSTRGADTPGASTSSRAQKTVATGEAAASAAHAPQAELTTPPPPPSSVSNEPPPAPAVTKRDAKPPTTTKPVAQPDAAPLTDPTRTRQEQLRAFLIQAAIRRPDTRVDASTTAELVLPASGSAAPVHQKHDVTPSPSSSSIMTKSKHGDAWRRSEEESQSLLARRLEALERLVAPAAAPRQGVVVSSQQQPPSATNVPTKAPTKRQSVAAIPIVSAPPPAAATTIYAPPLRLRPDAIQPGRTDALIPVIEQQQQQRRRRHMDPAVPLAPPPGCGREPLELSSPRDVIVEAVVQVFRRRTKSAGPSPAMTPTRPVALVLYPTCSPRGELAALSELEADVVVTTDAAFPAPSNTSLSIGHPTDLFGTSVRDDHDGSSAADRLASALQCVQTAIPQALVLASAPTAALVAVGSKLVVVATTGMAEVVDEVEHALTDASSRAAGLAWLRAWIDVSVPAFDAHYRRVLHVNAVSSDRCRRKRSELRQLPTDRAVESLDVDDAGGVNERRCGVVDEEDTEEEEEEEEAGPVVTSLDMGLRLFTDGVPAVLQPYLELIDEGGTVPPFVWSSGHCVVRGRKGNSGGDITRLALSPFVQQYHSVKLPVVGQPISPARVAESPTRQHAPPHLILAHAGVESHIAPRVARRAAAGVGAEGLVTDPLTLGYLERPGGPLEPSRVHPDAGGCVGVATVSSLAGRLLSALQTAVTREWTVLFATSIFSPSEGSRDGGGGGGGAVQAEDVRRLVETLRQWRFAFPRTVVVVQACPHDHRRASALCAKLQKIAVSSRASLEDAMASGV